MARLSIEAFEVGPMGNNAYLLVEDDAGKCALVDPGIGSEEILEHIRSRGWRLETVINTHGHFDHAYCDAWFVEATGASLLLHEEDASMLALLPQQAAWFGFSPPPVPKPTRLLRHGDTIAVGQTLLQVLHTPGHTPGGICLLAAASPPWVLTGDTLFAGSIGRTDLPGGDHHLLIASIRQKLLVLPADTLVYPGHGPSTTIGRERAANPFLAGAVG
ncbi:MAG: MBL fold metallo-hydrolase [Armatimonadota bacterium]|nr:MBL fold metallo-hydrolase [Armatimonadota bacterium]